MATRVVVAISVLDGAAFLGEAIESVLAQDGLEQLQVVVVDNGSTDGTQEIARGYRDVTLLENAPAPGHEPNFFHSMNRVLATLPCDVLAPFACDDRMLPGNLARKVAALRTSGAAIAHGPAELIDEHGAHLGVLSAPVGAGVVPAPGFFRRLVPVNTLITPTVVVRADALRAIGGFDPRSILCGDWLAWLRLSLRHAVAAIDEPLVQYRQHVETGSVQGLRSGRFATHDPAALLEACADPLLPAAWRAEVPRWLAAKLLHTAALLQDAGVLRRRDGVPAYAVAGRALLACPDQPQVVAAFRELARLAGLVAPATPFTVVAAHRGSLGEAESLVAALRALHAAGLVRRTLVAVDPDRLDDGLVELATALDDGVDVDVDVVPGAVEELLGRPALVLADDGDPLHALAEAHGLPSVEHRAASPYSRARDAARFEVIPPQTEERAA